MYTTQSNKESTCHVIKLVLNDRVTCSFLEIID